jgi:hypothetical protein
MGARTEKIAARKMVPRRPIKSLMGSEIQAVKRAIAMYGQELTKPTIQLFLRHIAVFAALASQRDAGPSGIPNCCAKVKLAPFEPV